MGGVTDKFGVNFLRKEKIYTKKGKFCGYKYIYYCIKCNSNKVYITKKTDSGLCRSCAILGKIKSDKHLKRKHLIVETFIKDNGRTGYKYKCINEYCNNTVTNYHKSGLCVNCANLKKRDKPFLRVYNRIKRTSNIRNIDFSLSYDEYVNILRDNNKCHYCDSFLDIKEYRQSASFLDRKNNFHGYSKDNVVLCCHECNTAKGNFFSYEEFLLISLIRRGREFEKDIFKLFEILL